MMGRSIDPRDVNDRRMGCMYGLAVGDALGAPVEFLAPGRFPKVKGYKDGGPFDLKAGEWTDDTSMALALADSISKGWYLNNQYSAYWDWYDKGKYSVNGRCFDIGSQTRQALKSWHTAGIADNSGEGNGCIMRLAPVVIRYHSHSSSTLATYCKESSMTTHDSRVCTDACLVLGRILAILINGGTKDEALLPSNFVFSNLHPNIAKIVRGSYMVERLIKSSGWVVPTLEAALWAFWKSRTFKTTVLRAVNLGNDADTTGAVAGQLAGAYYGLSGISADLIDGLARKDLIEKYLRPLLK